MQFIDLDILQTYHFCSQFATFGGETFSDVLLKLSNVF